MKLNSKVKPSKAASLVGAIVGLLFTVFGIVFFIVVSQEDGFWNDGGPAIVAFFVMFILVCIMITVFYGANYFSKKGISVLDIDIEKDEKSLFIEENDSIENRLIKLDALKNKGLITEDEYQQRKSEILKEI